MQGRMLRHASRTSSIVCLFLCLPAMRAGADDLLATVNGRPIRQADLHLEAVLRQLPADQVENRRDELLEDLIEQQLIAAFVARRRTPANPLALESQLERIEALIRRRGEEPEALLKRLGIAREQLRQRLERSLAWDAYVQQVTSERQLREHFEQHRRQLDGTQLRAQHILIQAAAEDAAARQTARRQLTQLREQIVAGKTTFEAAAEGHSQAPSAAEGGDVGYFGYRGTMSVDFADVAFALQVGDISEPVETPFGVHLIKVTQERPGELSLEDVRPQILQRISQQMWKARIAEDQPRAKIERH
jgi:parvulin-like peptidyl-prolyl isomerase